MSARRAGSCRCGLPRAEGRKGGGAWRRSDIGEAEVLRIEATRRPSGQRADSPFQSGGTPLGKPAAFRGRAAGAVHYRLPDTNALINFPPKDEFSTAPNTM